MIDFITNIDKEILYFIQEFLRYNFLNGIFSFITKLGNGGFIWILITIILLIPKRTRKVGILSLCSLLLCHVVNNLMIKNLVMRERPFNQFSELIPLVKKPTDFSFPSGHTAISFAVSGILVRYLDKKYGIAVRAGFHCAPLAHKAIGTEDGGCVRISVGCFNTGQEMIRTARAIRQISKDHRRE